MKIAIKAILVLLTITLGLINIVNTSLRKKSHNKRPYEQAYRSKCSSKCIAFSTLYFCTEDSSYLCSCAWGYSFAKHPSQNDAYVSVDSTKVKEAIKSGECRQI